MLSDPPTSNNVNQPPTMTSALRSSHSALASAPSSKLPPIPEHPSDPTPGPTLPILRRKRSLSSDYLTEEDVEKRRKRLAHEIQEAFLKHEEVQISARVVHDLVKTQEEAEARAAHERHLAQLRKDEAEREERRRIEAETARVAAEEAKTAEAKKAADAAAAAADVAAAEASAKAQAQAEAAQAVPAPNGEATASTTTTTGPAGASVPPPAPQGSHRLPQTVREDRYSRYHHLAAGFDDFYNSMKKQYLDLGKKRDFSDFLFLITTSVTNCGSDEKSSIEKARLVIDASRKFIADCTIMVDIRDHVMDPDTHELLESQQVPAALVLCFSQLAVKIVKAFEINRSDQFPWIANFFCLVLGQPEFWIQGQSMASLYLADAFYRAPILFGIQNSFTDSAGRECKVRQYADYTQTDRVLEGFGLMATWLPPRPRPGEAQARPPIQPRALWFALANILNTPRPNLTDRYLGHLKSLLASSADRFLACYGDDGVTVVRYACKTFPTLFPQSTESTHFVNHFKAVLEKYKIAL